MKSKMTRIQDFPLNLPQHDDNLQPRQAIPENYIENRDTPKQLPANFDIFSRQKTPNPQLPQPFKLVSKEENKTPSLHPELKKKFGFGEKQRLNFEMIPPLEAK